MAKTLSRFYFLKKDEHKEKATLFVRVQDPNRRIDVQFTTGFFYGKPDHESQIYDSNTYVKEYTYLGIVGEKDTQGRYAIEQRNKFSVGEEIEVMKPDGENVCVTVKGIWDDEGNQMESAPHPKQKLWIDLGVELDRFDILRRKEME